jgi:hypothetical protein
VGSNKFKLSILARTEEEGERARKHADNTKGRRGGEEYEEHTTELEQLAEAMASAGAETSFSQHSNKMRGVSTSLSTRPLGSSTRQRGAKRA